MLRVASLGLIPARLILQYEGGATEGGRGPSIWDTFTHNHPDKIADHKTADVAIDSYHRYKEDVEVMKNMGMDAYRFSISWSRLLPKGNLRGGVNKEGIQYYNDLINELLDKGIKPFVTLFHWDLPDALEKEYGGFLSQKIVKDFEEYAELCFKEFGDRVKHWITLNEPWSYSDKGYAEGLFAPGRCSDWQKANCFGGDSGTEPYLASHYQLLSHAAAVKLYRQKYQGTQKGKIGITNLSHWFIPYSDSDTDQAAALRAIDFMFGWYMDPIVTGDYPHSMRLFVGDRLPKFSEEESNMLKGSFDFLGVNYYTANYARYAPEFSSRNSSYLTDAWVQLSTEKNGVPIGEPTSLDWLFVYPRGIYDLLLYIKQKYGDQVIYITENGVNEGNSASSLEEALVDHKRIYYYYHHLLNLQRAIEDGVNVKGFFAWSMFDNFEWNVGFSVRFGLNYIDYEKGQQRHPKLSAKWFKEFLAKDTQESPLGDANYQSYSDL